MLQRLAPWIAAIVLTVACSQSDPGITTAVKTKISADDTVKAYQIDVDTSDRVVTLTGTVETSAAKDQAVMLARQTNGVRDVVDHLNVNPATAATTGDIREEANEAAHEAREEAREAADKAKELGREAQSTARETAERTGAALTDAAVTSAVKTKFLADTAVAGLKIDVDTNAGNVTLTGTVATKAEADRAVFLARDTNGV
jgi:hyperosmotically inducible periplasmic protein